MKKSYASNSPCCLRRDKVKAGSRGKDKADAFPLLRCFVLSKKRTGTFSFPIRGVGKSTPVAEGSGERIRVKEEDGRISGGGTRALKDGTQGPFGSSLAHASIPPCQATILQSALVAEPRFVEILHWCGYMPRGIMHTEAPNDTASSGFCSV